MLARWWKKNNDITVSCNLCFRGCNIKPGNSGRCGVRFNENGILVSPWLGRFYSRAIDPVEKKPLFHWNEGSFIYSLGSIGCIMDCPFCQNHHIARPEESLYKNFSSVPELPIFELVRNVEELGLNLVAFTYNEPLLQAEYICSSAHILHDSGISLALVTNGAMSHEVTEDLLKCLNENDAANIDIKAFNPETYKKLGGNLETVKGNIKAFVKAGLHVELTSLIVPRINDNVDEFTAMVEWIASISPEIPLHITRYFPARNYHEPPTSKEFLYLLASIAKKSLKYIHLGNI